MPAPGPENVSFLLAFGAGVLSFISPCILPLVPSYLSFVTGMTFARGAAGPTPREVRRTTVTHSALFILGFSLVFVLLGASATAAGRILRDYHEVIRRVGGILVILLGLHLAEVIRIPFLLRERRLTLRDKPAGYLGSVAVGVAFAAGWTPCVGPILGTILLYASTTGRVGLGVALLATYSLGLGIPFLVASWGVGSFFTHFDRFRRHLRLVSVISGGLLIVVGAMILTNTLSVLSGYLFQKLPFLAL